jgi:hypothetical protein
LCSYVIVRACSSGLGGSGARLRHRGRERFRVFGFPYAAAALGSWLIYAGAGFFGARAGGSVWMGVLAAATAGLVDSTAGWLISALIGPGRPTGEAATPAAIVAAVVMVPVFAGVVGAIGAVLAKLTGPGPRAA